jgi:hypothetical protein
LLNLAATLEALDAKSIAPSLVSVGSEIRGPQNEADEGILGWCDKHGLIGLVPVLSDFIELPTTIEPGTDKSPLLVTTVTYHREGGIWSERISMHVTEGNSIDAQDRAARLAEECTPSFNWLDLDFQDSIAKPFSHLREYFTDYDDDGFTPGLPNGNRFWHAYSEPLDDFARWSLVFRKSVECLSQWRSHMVHDNHARSAANLAHSALTALAEPAAPTFRFRPERDRVDEERVSAGLLSSYALMFLWDREEGRRALRCNNCSAFFVSDDPRAGYCSRRCRNTASNRRYRMGKRNPRI